MSRGKTNNLIALLLSFHSSAHSVGDGMKFPQLKRLLSLHRAGLITPCSLIMVLTRGISLKRIVIYGVGILVVIMVFQIWKQPCFSPPFGGQVI